MNTPKGDPRFHALLQQLGELHDRKQADYGSESDPFANIRATLEFGMPAWVGGLMRANDKMHRLKQFARRGTLANEGAEDSMLDLAVYSLIALILFRELTEDPYGADCCQTPGCEHAPVPMDRGEEWAADMGAPAGREYPGDPPPDDYIQKPLGAGYREGFGSEGEAPT